MTGWGRAGEPGSRAALAELSLPSPALRAMSLIPPSPVTSRDQNIPKSGLQGNHPRAGALWVKCRTLGAARRQSGMVINAHTALAGY